MKGTNICRVLDYFRTHDACIINYESVRELAKACELPVIMSSEDKQHMRCINYDDGLHLAVTFFADKMTACFWFESRDKRVELVYGEK
jgi:hypothetical protein